MGLIISEKGGRENGEAASEFATATALAFPDR